MHHPSVASLPYPQTMPPQKCYSKAKVLQVAASSRCTHSTQNAQNDAHSHVVWLEKYITRSRVLRAQARPTIHLVAPPKLNEIFILALPTNEKLFDGSRFSTSERRRLTNPQHMLIMAVLFPNCGRDRHPYLTWHNEVQASNRRKAANIVQWIKRSRSLLLTLHISIWSYCPLGIFAFPRFSTMVTFVMLWQMTLIATMILSIFK